MEVDHLFVYGTLRPDLDAFASGRLCNLPWQRAITPGMLFDLGSYPAMVPTFAQAPAARVRGCLIGMIGLESEQNALLESLDVYEGVAHGLYTREVIRTYPRSGGLVYAWAYLFARQIPTGSVLLASGDYSKVSEDATR